MTVHELGSGKTKIGKLHYYGRNQLMTVKVSNKKALRFNEYYDTQKIQDELYQLSAEGSHVFRDLMSYITQEENII